MLYDANDIRVPHSNNVDLQIIWSELKERGLFEVEKSVLSFNASPAIIADIQVSNIGDCYKYPTPSLATCSKYRTRNATFFVLQSLLLYFNQKLAPNRQMTENAISFGIEDIIREYSYLTIAELKLALQSGYSGVYGQLYGAVDMLIVLEWLSKFDMQRSMYLERLQIEKSKELSATVGEFGFAKMLNEKMVEHNGMTMTQAELNALKIKEIKESVGLSDENTAYKKNTPILYMEDAEIQEFFSTVIENETEC